MHMEESGALVSVDGYPVLDAGNAGILLDPNAGPPTIAQDGMITQKGRQIGAIGIFTLDDGANNGVAQGFIEGSNVNPVFEMAKLIMVSRAFESISSATEGSETTLKDAIKTLGATS